MTASAGIVGVQRMDLVEPQQPAEIGQLWIKRPPKPRLERSLNRSSETSLLQHRCERVIQILWILAMNQATEDEEESTAKCPHTEFVKLTGHMHPSSNMP